LDSDISIDIFPLCFGVVAFLTHSDQVGAIIKPLRIPMAVILGGNIVIDDAGWSAFTLSANRVLHQDVSTQ
jgi:hypothetical protein